MVRSEGRRKKNIEDYKCGGVVGRRDYRGDCKLGRGRGESTIPNLDEVVLNVDETSKCEEVGSWD